MDQPSVLQTSNGHVDVVRALWFLLIVSFHFLRAPPLCEWVGDYALSVGVSEMWSGGIRLSIGHWNSENLRIVTEDRLFIEVGNRVKMAKPMRLTLFRAHHSA